MQGLPTWAPPCTASSQWCLAKGMASFLMLASSTFGRAACVKAKLVSAPSALDSSWQHVPRLQVLSWTRAEQVPTASLQERAEACRASADSRAAGKGSADLSCRAHLDVWVVSERVQQASAGGPKLGHAGASSEVGGQMPQHSLLPAPKALCHV